MASGLQRTLSADCYRVLVAPDRAKALALLSTGQPDLLLVDINGDTLSLIDVVRSGEGIAGLADPDTLVIALGRDAGRLQRIRLLDRGSDDVVKNLSLTRSCAPESPPCCAAGACQATGGSCGPGRFRSTPPGATCGSASAG
ncbi:MAG: response regulator transcription factor [Solirubrobacterales bacterium]|nr:response regulator transcription factor [Solirubrobacterales bacterium]